MGKWTNKKVFDLMEKWAPLNLAYDWDNVGLQVGSANKEVKKVMITLDVLESVVDEAITEKVDLIIAHHPMLFKALKKIDTNTPKGRVLEKLIKHDITVYAAHTNLDIAADGVNDMLLDQLKLTKTANLQDTGEKKLYKLAVFIPKDYVDEVSEALAQAGAGHIGNYSNCTFQTEGTGTFKPLEGTKPFIGEQNQIERVEEMKVEVIVSEEKIQQVIHVLLEAHPYEEVAYDVYLLANKDEAPLGIGRVGSLNQAVTFQEFIQQVKENLGLANVRVTGNLDKKVKKVAILGGSGEKYIHQALRMGADVYVTGDMTFHMAQDAMELGLCVIDAGHYIEQIMKEVVQEKLAEQLADSAIEVIISKENTNPFHYM